MSRVLLGALTIGESPRADIVPVLASALPPTVDVLHAGVLDGLTRQQVNDRYAPSPGARVFISRMADGTPVTLDAERIRAAVQDRISALELRGCDVILLLCTGIFTGLTTSRAWLVEPDRVLPVIVAAIAQGRRVGVVVPLAQQVGADVEKWRLLPDSPICAAASPYAESSDALQSAAKDIRRRGGDLIVLDCIGFTEQHRDIALRAAGAPVLLSCALVARVTAELCAAHGARPSRQVQPITDGTAGGHVVHADEHVHGD